MCVQNGWFHIHKNIQHKPACTHTHSHTHTPQPPPPQPHHTQHHARTHTHPTTHHHPHTLTPTRTHTHTHTHSYIEVCLTCVLSWLCFSFPSLGLGPSALKDSHSHRLERHRDT